MNPGRKKREDADREIEAQRITLEMGDLPQRGPAPVSPLVDAVRSLMSGLLLLAVLLGVLRAIGFWLETEHLEAAYEACRQVCADRPAEVGLNRCVCPVESVAQPRPF